LSVENETIVVVRPWKLPPMTMIVPQSSGRPLVRLPHRRVTLIAVSTASAPEFIGRMRSLPVRAHRSRANGPSWSEWKARLVSVRVRSCRSATSMSRGLECPKLSAE